VLPPKAITRQYAIALGALGIASFAVIVVLGTRLTFFNDDWYFLLQRPGLESHGGLDVLLAPHNSNLVLLPALAYKLLVAIFGLSSQLPFRVVLAVLLVSIGVLVFLLVSARVGQLLGLACVAVVLFLGAAWEDLLFFASIDLVGSVAAGLTALWALERDGARSRAVACALLVCSVAFSNVGIPFALAAAVLVLLRAEPRRLWVAVVPVLLFGLWWAVDGSAQPSHLSAHNIEHLPRYIYDSLSAGLASATGLGRGSPSDVYTHGHIVLAVVAAGTVVAALAGWRPRRTVLIPVTAALAFWCLTGASYYAGRDPFASRYQLIDVVLLILIAAELARGAELGRLLRAVVVLATAAIVFSNIEGPLSYGYNFLARESAYVKAELGALEIAGNHAPPGLQLTDAVAHDPFLSGVTAGRLWAETRAHGNVPSYTPAQIMAASPLERQGADGVLALAERLAPLPPAAAGYGQRGCLGVNTGPSGHSSEAQLAPGTWLLINTGKAGLAVGVRRFAPAGLPVYVALIAPRQAERLTIPRDTVAIPWNISLRGASSARLALRACPG
jgi:hypothetical protein